MPESGLVDKSKSAIQRNRSALDAVTAGPSGRPNPMQQRQVPKAAPIVAQPTAKRGKKKKRAMLKAGDWENWGADGLLRRGYSEAEVLQARDLQQLKDRKEGIDRLPEYYALAATPQQQGTQ